LELGQPRRLLSVAFGEGEHMVGWREKLTRLVELAPTLHPPADSFRLRPPSRAKWPRDLPKGPTLPEFYTVCDGGRFPEGRGYVEIFRLAQLGARSQQVAMQIADDLEAQRLGAKSPYILGRHVVFGWTSDAINLIWDTETDHVIGHSPFDDNDWIEADYQPEWVMDEQPVRTLAGYLEELLSIRPDRQMRGVVMTEWWFKRLTEVGADSSPGTAPKRRGRAGGGGKKGSRKEPRRGRKPK
jgi:hypothetical protein